MKRTQGPTQTRSSIKSLPPPKPKNKPEPETESIVYAELPDVREIRCGAEVANLLIELDSVTLMEKAAKERGDEIKLELTATQGAFGLPGLRFETYCFVARAMPGRKSLDKELLLENGVKPQVIKDSMKTGDPYIQRTFKNIAK